MNPISPSELRKLGQLALKSSGLQIQEFKIDFVQRRLRTRLRTLGLPSYDRYLEILETEPIEMQICLNLLTTNLTSFFREPHHFETLKLSMRESNQNVRILSAGCSSGEEAYSIAVTLMETGALKSRIVAGDVNEDVLEIARTGIYPIELLEGLTPEQKVFFQKGAGPNEGRARVKPRLKELISFQYLNLSHDLTSLGHFHYIFCRNVLIYFDRTIRRRVLQNFAKMLVPKGLLFLGHSESCHDFSVPFKQIGRTTYRRKS